jgi:hypothetical protein
LDQKIQVWNAVGTWLAGIATLAAVLVSLHLARRSEKVQLRAFAGIRLLVRGDGAPSEQHVAIGVTNLGDRTVTISSIGWAVGKGKSRSYCIQTVSGPWTSQYPIELSHGKGANFMVSFDDTPTWLADFSKKFLSRVRDKELDTLVAQIHTSIGQTIEVEPEESLMSLLREMRNH